MRSVKKDKDKTNVLFNWGKKAKRSATGIMRCKNGSITILKCVYLKIYCPKGFSAGRYFLLCSKISRAFPSKES